MQRITISVSDAFSDELEQIRHERGYRTRSEVMRDLVREGMERWREEKLDSAQCVANLSYVYDRRVRALAQRLTEMQNAHHDLIEATMAVRLDHFYTMESVMLSGPTAAVSAFADEIRAERGVRSGSINLLRVKSHDHHEHATEHVHTGRPHLSPLG